MLYALEEAHGPIMSVAVDVHRNLALFSSGILKPDRGKVNKI